MALKIFLSFLGGGLGASLRYVLHYFFSGQTAFQTLMPNILGCFLLGLIFQWAFVQNEQMKILLIIGFLGGLTTFSSYIFYMVQPGQTPQKIVFYFFASHILSFLAFIVGSLISSLFVKSLVA